MASRELADNVMDLLNVLEYMGQQHDWPSVAEAQREVVVRHLERCHNRVGWYENQITLGEAWLESNSAD
ncbi:unnamed protein product [marine sediment metagenome]|uniref:Uncharacterized protein n=1 Tax=marine sediment metagenome TaxID=412755 RepID=X0WAC9_9ZZZZ